MTDFKIDALTGNVVLEPGGYQLFTTGNASMPFGGAVAGTDFVVPEPTASGGTPAPGLAGKSAYQSWLDIGHTGTEADFIASLKGAPGTPGTSTGGGSAGESAYQIAVDNGFVGTQVQWLASLKGIPGDPGTSTATGGSGGLFNPSSLAAFESAVQAALDGGYTLFCDPTASVTFDRGLHFTVSDRGQQGHGVIGNGMKLINTIPGAPTYMMDFELPASQNQNRHLHVGGFSFSGYGPSNNNAHGLRFICNGGGWYELVVETNNFEGCGDCLTLDGNVFEFIVREQVYINSDRCVVASNPGGQNVKVLSNCLLDWATYKQCRIGIELDVANSVICRGGSFVDITERSLKASNGIKNFDNGHFENGGDGYAIDMPAQDWPGTLTNCTLSNTRGGNPFIARYMGDPAKLCAGFNRIHVGTSIFTADSTVPANYTKL